MCYILVMPVKNEACNLKSIVKCVVDQTVLPKLWVIIDGKSTDGTREIIVSLSKSYEWIFLKDQENFSQIGGHMNFSLAVSEGYEYAKRICATNKIKYDFVAKIDGDVLIPRNFFEFLISRFKEDSSLGVASGISLTLNPDIKERDYQEINNNDATVDTFLYDELPDKRLYRKIYLEEIGGFPLTKFSPDSILLAKFRIHERTIKRFKELKMFNLRKDSGIERNSWKSAKSVGEARYYLNYHPLLVLLGAAFLMINKSFSQGLAFILGYAISYAKRNDQIDDLEIRNYFMKRRLKEIVNNYRNLF